MKAPLQTRCIQALNRAGLSDMDGQLYNTSAPAIVRFILRKARAEFKVAKPTPAKVWVLTMDIQNGGIYSHAFSSEDAAKTHLYSHATEYWAQEMGSEPLPTDRNKVIESYFGRDDADDSYILTECEVED